MGCVDGLVSVATTTKFCSYLADPSILAIVSSGDTGALWYPMPYPGSSVAPAEV